MKMDALRFHAWSEPPRLERVPVPVAGPGESLIRVRAAAVGHLDRTIASGEFAARPTLPYIGGVRGAGEIVHSSTFPAGTPVSVRGSGVGMTRSGVWSEFVAVPDAAVTPIPAGLPFALGASAPDPLATAHIALSTTGRLGEWDSLAAEEETVMVTGANGAVGSLIAQLALRSGARVIALVRSPESAALLPAGVEALVEPVGAARAKLAEERPLSVLIDTVGGQGLAERLGWVRAGGRAVVVGYLAGEELQLDLPNWLFADVALLPVNLMRHPETARAAVDRLLPLLRDGALTLAVTSVPLENGPAAYIDLAEGRLRTRLVVTPTL